MNPKRLPVFTVYDISEDSQRKKYSHTLIYYGLHRVQYSMFFGYLTPKELKKLVNWTKNFQRSENDTIHIIKICRKCLDQIIVLGGQRKTKEHLIL